MVSHLKKLVPNGIDSYIYIQLEIIILYHQLPFMNIILEPCATGYQYKRGTSTNDTIRVITDPGIGNEECSVQCTNTTECTAYEYYEYNSTRYRTCKLFSTSETTRDGSSGFYHCERLGIYTYAYGISCLNI